MDNFGKPNVCLYVFTYGGVIPQTAFALTAELRLADKNGTPIELRNVHNDALISRSRSKALTDFLLETKAADVCVMVDHDLEWEAGMVAALAAKSFDVQSCVAGLYACRGIGCGVATRASQPVSFKPLEDKLIEAEYLASGFLAIPRCVVDEVLGNGIASRANPLDFAASGDANAAIQKCKYMDGSTMYDFFRPISVPLETRHDGAYEYLSEDYAFSWRCRQANPSRKLYAWSKPWLRHHGSHPFTLDQAYVPRTA